LENACPSEDAGALLKGEKRQKKLTSEDAAREKKKTDTRRVIRTMQ
jgi:hypothetical protein